jgi:fructuronate reductase
MDGAKKLKEFAKGTIIEIIAKNGDFTCAAMLFASWVRYMTGINEQGETFDINDPMKDTFTPLAKAVNEANGFDPVSITKECLGDEIAGHAGFIKAVQECLVSLNKNGAKQTLTDYHNKV